jgi:hypothetical protein
VFWKVFVFISTMSSALKKVARMEVSFVAGSLTQYLGATGRTHAEDTVSSSCEKKNTGPKFGKWLSSK